MSIQRNNAPSWILAGATSSLSRLEPLIEAHRAQRPVHIVAHSDAIGSVLNEAAGVLVVGGTAPPEVFMRAPNGTRIPVGWLPDAKDRLACYARAAAEVQARTDTNASVALLGEFDPRALALVSRVAAALPADAATFQWTAERLSQAALIEALGCGPGLALYFGHAVAGGWAGYGGFGCNAISRVARGRPIGALMSIACSAASRPRRGFSFCEEAVLSGACAAAFGARGRTLHHANADLGLALARVLAASPVPTLGALLLAASPADRALHRYRIIGDPLARLLGAPGSIAAARSVFAPAPDDPLPVIPLGAWTTGMTGTRLPA
jgi:hypothetical protein